MFFVVLENVSASKTIKGRKSNIIKIMYAIEIDANIEGLAAVPIFEIRQPGN